MKINIEKLKTFLNSDVFNRFIIILIILNAAILGLETYPAVVLAYGGILDILDKILLYIFVVEIFLKFLCYRLGFMRDSWNVMDVFIIIPAVFLESYESLSVLRILRVFRILRLISASESLRRVVEGLIRAIPGLKSISGILLVFLYMFSVMSTKLFGEKFPSYFGDIQSSLFSLFQITTLQGGFITREIANVYSFGAAFFVSYILISTICILNLCVAVIVDAVQSGPDNMKDSKYKKIDELGKKMDEIKDRMDRILKKDSKI